MISILRNLLRFSDLPVSHGSHSTKAAAFGCLAIPGCSVQKKSCWLGLPGEILRPLLFILLHFFDAFDTADYSPLLVLLTAFFCGCAHSGRKSFILLGQLQRKLCQTWVWLLMHSWESLWSEREWLSSVDSMPLGLKNQNRDLEECDLIASVEHREQWCVSNDEVHSGARLLQCGLTEASQALENPPQFATSLHLVSSLSHSKG